tara:strand:- start:903 stop:1379 length:477 start_codon:yes stop_codon:yes gene_type:complete
MNNKFILKSILLISIFSLLAAYFIEYILNYKPCNLCIFERIPYFASSILIVLNLYSKRFEKFTFGILSIIFAIGAIISFYHFGIEQGFFEESFVCISDDKMNNLAKEDLLKSLQKTTVSCKQVDFKLFGLSLATINTFLSIVLSAISFRAFFNYEKNR